MMRPTDGEESDTQLRQMLRQARRIAVVGLSPRPDRPSHGVAAYLQRHGYRIYPVNPTAADLTILGCHVYASLAELPEPPDIIDVFRRSQHVSAVVDDAIAARAAVRPTTTPGAMDPLWVLWTQLGVINEAATERARARGFVVVEERCLRIEHARLAVGRVD
jgi:predicted CoA-binding protein